MCCEQSALMEVRHSIPFLNQDFHDNLRILCCRHRTTFRLRSCILLLRSAGPQHFQLRDWLVSQIHTYNYWDAVGLRFHPHHRRRLLAHKHCSHKQSIPIPYPRLFSHRNRPPPRSQLRYRHSPVVDSLRKFVPAKEMRFGRIHLPHRNSPNLLMIYRQCCKHWGCCYFLQTRRSSSIVKKLKVSLHQDRSPD